MVTKAEKLRHRWICVVVAPQMERRAANALKEKRIATYLPTERRVRRCRSGRVTQHGIVETPLFPGYLFVCLTNNRLCELRGVDGVLGYMGRREGRAIPVPQKDITRFRVAQAMGEYDYTPKPLPKLEPGQPVRVVRGPFTGYKAEFMSERSEKRVEVLLQALTRGAGKHPLVIDVDFLEVEDHNRLTAA